MNVTCDLLNIFDNIPAEPTIYIYRRSYMTNIFKKINADTTKGNKMVTKTKYTQLPTKIQLGIE